MGRRFTHGKVDVANQLFLLLTQQHLHLVRRHIREVDVVVLGSNSTQNHLYGLQHNTDNGVIGGFKLVWRVCSDFSLGREFFGGLLGAGRAICSELCECFQCRRT